MTDIKEDLKHRLADEGVLIDKEDPLFTLIDIVTLWISENNKSLVQDLIRKVNNIDSVERRERLKQAKHMTDIVHMLELDLSESQKKTLHDIVNSAITETIEEMEKKLHPPWWKSPICYIGGINTVIGLAILGVLAFT